MTHSRRIERLAEQIRPKDKVGPLVATVGVGYFADHEELEQWWDAQGFTRPKHPIAVSLDQEAADVQARHRESRSQERRAGGDDLPRSEGSTL